MSIVPVRLIEFKENGVLCRMGSEPEEDAEKVLVPNDCILNKSFIEGNDLGVLVLDMHKAPEQIKKALKVN
jgi:hypothetical protein